LPGITTSAITRSGLSSRVFAIASSPLSTVVMVKSSVLKIIPITFRMVTESSAISSVLGIEALARVLGEMPGNSHTF
jgi:hypothetical protein